MHNAPNDKPRPQAWQEPLRGWDLFRALLACAFIVGCIAGGIWG